MSSPWRSERQARHEHPRCSTARELRREPVPEDRGIPALPGEPRRSQALVLQRQRTVEAVQRQIRQGFL